MSNVILLFGPFAADCGAVWDANEQMGKAARIMQARYEAIMRANFKFTPNSMVRHDVAVTGMDVVLRIALLRGGGELDFDGSRLA